MPLWFANKDDYASVSAGDIIETHGLGALLEGDADATITLLVKRRDGSDQTIPTKHTLSSDQLKWIRAGSALSYIRQQKVGPRV